MNSFDEDKKIAECVINKEIVTLEKLRDSLDTHLSEAIDVLENVDGPVILTGMSKSGHIAKKIAASLASTGTPSFFLHPAEASHGDLGMITDKDVVIAISNSGEAKELVDIINYCKRFGITIIAITKNADSTLGKASDIVLLLPQNGEACPLGLAPTNSTTATLVMGDILTVELMERKGFTKSAFKLRHPGGKLGSILQKISDVMHKGDDIPLLEVGADMKSVLFEMTSKRLGCVGLIDNDHNLVGIITDGDLRRNFSNNILDLHAKDLMKTNPITIDAETFCSEALKIMNDNKITNLFITQANKPIGVIHIHDLLSQGVM